MSEDGRMGAGRRRAWLDPFFGLLRWIGARVRGFHAALGAFLVLGLALVLGSVLLFAWLAEEVQEGETLAVDEAILRWMDAHSAPWLDAAALEVTALGGIVVTWMILLSASVLFWTSRHRYSVLLLWAAYLGGIVINYTLKALFARPRPRLFEWRTPLATHSSFPSGHSMTAVAVFATLAYLIVRLEPTRVMRRLTVAMAGVVILMVGVSRVYLGVHYPSDVVGGFAVGLAWASVCALGIEAARYYRRRRPRVEREEEGIEEGLTKGP